MLSVCIATYNGERYILEQLRSILAQLPEDAEVVVSDDDSTDRTCEIINSIGDNRIRLFRNHSHNIKWNFQNAMQHALGDIIFLSDQDDVWLPGKIERCVEILKDYDLVIHDSRLCDEQLQVVSNSFFDFYHSGKGILKNSLNNTYFGACMAFRRRVMDSALPLPNTQEVGHDIWLGLVAEMKGKVCFLHEPYLLYRRHDLAHTNLNQSLLTRSKRPLWLKCWSRVAVLWEVLKFKVR